MSSYIGNSPQFGVFRKLDALTFNGSTTTFNITSGGANTPVGDASQLFISLNGVIQEPGVAFTLANGGTQIVFSTAPTNGMAFFGVLLGVKGAPTVDDGQITPAKLDRTYATPADVTTAINNLPPSGGATGGANNKVFYENDQTVSANYTITSGKNAITAGPIIIADGVSVVIPDGTVWTIV